MTGALDHLVVAAEDLGAGAAALAALLGVEPEAGGRHAAFGTHNRLWRLGPGEYLEVIAPDPEAPPPGRARWFDLDRFAGPARLTNWVVRTDRLDRLLAAAPEGTGDPMRLARGDFAWVMAVPPDGRLPFDGGFPALIGWEGAHPADRLPDRGLRLQALRIAHPQAAALAAALAPVCADPRVTVLPGPAPRLSAIISTPNGPVAL